MAFPHGLKAILLHVPTVLLTALLLIGGLGAAQAATVYTFTSTDVPKPIPDPITISPANPFGGPADSTIVVSGIQTQISKLTVSLFITHEWIDDITISLIPPGGAPIVVLASGLPGPTPPYNGYNRSAGQTRGYGNGVVFPTAFGPTTNEGRVVFDDASPFEVDAIISGSVTLSFDAMGNPIVTDEWFVPSGIYNCQGAAVLSVYANLTPAQLNGTWTLRVVDSFSTEDNGLLRAWSMSITDPGQHVWTGASIPADPNWSNPANWQAANLPTMAETAAQIVFPLGAQQMTTSTNNIGDLGVGLLTIAEGYTLSGTKITMAVGGTISCGSGAAGTATIAMGVDLRGAATITSSAGAVLDITGNIANDLAATGSIVVNGPGTLRLSGNNGFSGAATVNSGAIVDVRTATALGTNVGATTVISGGTVLIAAAITINEPLIASGTGTAGQGALSATANATWSGPITLAAGITGFGSTAATLTVNNFAAVPAGSYNFSKVGSGDVVLGAALPASTVLGAYDGGTLTVNAAQPNIVGIALTGGTTIASGGNVMTLAGGISCSASPTASTITGNLDVGTAVRGLDVASGSILAIPAGLTITGAGGLAKSGGGTLTWSATAGGVPLSMSAGTLAGSGGTMGALTVSGGVIDRAGALDTGALNMGASSLFRFNGTGDQLNVTGGVTLGGGLLQPFAAAGTVINNITAGSVNGIFRGMPEGSGVTYVSGGNDVALSGLSGNTVGFVVSSYTTAENGGSVAIQLISTGGTVTVAIDSFGGTATAGADFILPSTLVSVPITGTTIYIPIVNDNLSEGTEVANLVIIPVSGGHLASPATASTAVTIVDDDDQGKKCGIGTGLTVFFLFGFGLLLRLRLRRRH